MNICAVTNTTTMTNPQVVNLDPLDYLATIASAVALREEEERNRRKSDIDENCSSSTTTTTTNSSGNSDEEDEESHTISITTERIVSEQDDESSSCSHSSNTTSRSSSLSPDHTEPRQKYALASPSQEEDEEEQDQQHRQDTAMPPPSKEFLGDLNPSLKRMILASHTAYCTEVKEQENRKRWRDRQIVNKYFHNHNLHANDNSQKQEQQQQQQQEQQEQRFVGMKRKHSLSDGTPAPTSSSAVSVDNDVQNGTVNTAPPQWKEEEFLSIFHMEPTILRMSMYEKFLTLYQFYYNQHDAKGLKEFVMNPYANVSSVIRQNKLWARVKVAASPLGQKPVQMSSSVGTTAPNTSTIMVTIKNEVFVGLDSFIPICEKVFEVTPDCLMLYKQSKMKFSPQFGTIVVTPFTYFATYLVPDTNNPGQTKHLRAEIQGWNVSQFDLSNRLVWRLDNFIVHSFHDILYDISPEALWNFVWGKRQQLQQQQSC